MHISYNHNVYLYKYMSSCVVKVLFKFTRWTLWSLCGHLITNNSPIRNLAILADFVCITTSNSHHSRDGGSVRGVRDNGTEGITHTMFARIARFRIREYYRYAMELSDLREKDF